MRFPLIDIFLNVGRSLRGTLIKLSFKNMMFSTYQKLFYFQEHDDSFIKFLLQFCSYFFGSQPGNSGEFVS